MFEIVCYLLTINIMITYSPSSPPQRYRKPLTMNTRENIVTPPSSPSKSKLTSPSKKNRIPPSPHRPNVDAFWSNEFVNEWNDRHSPTKQPDFSQEIGMLSINDDLGSKFYSSFPLRSAPVSPVKKNQSEIQKRKKFHKDKHELATAFLKELDQTITNGQIGSLASSAGGIPIVWSNKLQRTAGRAHWRGENVFSGPLEGPRVKTGFRHHAKIELAEKVIDNEGKRIFMLSCSAGNVNSKLCKTGFSTSLPMNSVIWRPS